MTEQTAEQRMLKGLRQLIEYNWRSEEQHFYQEGEPDGHIFRVLRDLNHYSEDTEQQDTLTIFVDGEYYPAKFEWHENDVVEQYVLVIDEGDQENA